MEDVRKGGPRRFSVLLTSAGRRVSLVRGFQAAMRALGIEGRVVAADLKRTAPAMHAADANLLVPRVTSPEYVEFVLEFCKREGVAAVIPLIDTELHVFAPHRRRFLDAGVELVVSDPEVTEICLDKRRTAEFFARAGFDSPAILDARAVLADDGARYPLFLKPAAGSCSVGAMRIETRRELEFHVDQVEDAIVQELVAGDEYTLDVLADFEGRVRCVVPRLRMETRAGEISKGVTVKDPLLLDAGARVVEALHGARGCLTVQLFLGADRSVKMIEINPRFGGGFPLSLAAGADYPRWILEWVAGADPAISNDSWRDGAAMLRYDEAIFLRREDLE